MPLVPKPSRSTNSTARSADSLRFVGLSATPSSGAQPRNAPRFARILLIALGVACVGAGLALGDTHAIFQKAIFICMECIGIG
ncbi:MAG: hypothetical protein J6I73_09080 [Treponema sp.]|nr:hypothetical protein [Treponema sp.]